MDTSAWNALARWQQRRSLRSIKGPEYLISDCNLDQFAAASHYVAKDLATLAWRLTNRRRLADHVELMIEEITAYEDRRPIRSIYKEHPGFELAWNTIRTSGAPREMKALADDAIRDAKRQFRDHLRAERSTFFSFFQGFESLGFKKPWAEMLDELEREGYIGQYLENIVRHFDVPHSIRAPSKIHEIPYRELPATAAGTQYYMALSFRAAYEKGKNAKPDYDDQTDFRHAYYAGVADVFVCEDRKMKETLEEYVVTKQSVIVTLAEFLSRMGAPA